MPSLRRMHVNAFPAIHVKKMDWLDFAFKFSSELVFLGLAVLVALANLYFFSGSNQTAFADQSLAAELLANHSGMNSKVATRNSSIVTTVAGSGLFPEAQAEDFGGITSELTGQTTATSPSADAGGITMADDNSSFVQPNPDSVSALIAKQIKIYTTKPGDTLKSVALANGISEQTIIWANNLPSNTIKPGWQLIILPTDGVLVTAGANDTLPDIAYRYSPQRYNNDKKVRDDAANQLLDKIISYNLLDGPEDISAGDLIIVPGGVIASPPAPPKPVTPKTTKPGKPSVLQPGQEYIPPSDSGSSGHIFPWGQCTWYVAKIMHDEYSYDIPWGGNAKAWLANAQAYGAVTSKQPAPGTIVVTNESRFGHVAIVKEVTDDSIVVSEMNYKGKGIVDTRTIPLGSGVIRGFIYR